MTDLTLASFKEDTLLEYQSMKDELEKVSKDLDELNSIMAENILKEIDILIKRDELAFVDGRISAIFNLILSSLDDDD